MTFGGTYATALLFIGDIAIFILSLFFTLAVRSVSVPSGEVFLYHLAPFSIVFAAWALVFFIAGLYEKRLVFSESVLLGTLLKTQVANIILAALFFVLSPAVPIAPRASLILYLGISLALILVWRLVLFPLLTHPRERVHAVLVGEGEEAKELMGEVNTRRRMPFVFSRLLSVDEGTDARALVEILVKERAGLLVVDTTNARVRNALPELLRAAREAGAEVAEFEDAYEEVFDRIPLSLLSRDWFDAHARVDRSSFYVAGKRALDILGAFLMGGITILITPVVALLLLSEGKGPVFIAQKRFGRHGTRITAYKFRTMSKHDARGAWLSEGENRITKVGEFLRRTSLDEFPQFINVLRGELSLVGPRNDIEALGERLGDALPYYRQRYLVLPGITGWAQVNQQYEQGNISPQSIEETKVRLAYDFYYLKHQSLALDIIIALKTMKRMFFRVVQ